jgi:membrane protein DedA with SNARE-associated domain
MLGLEQYLTHHPLIIFSVLGFICFLEGLPVVGTFVAGGTVGIAAGAFAAQGIIDPLTVFLVCTFGSFLGDMVGYYLLLNMRSKYLRFQKFVEPISQNQSWVARYFDQNYILVTIIARTLPVVRSLPTVFAAVRRVHAPTYIGAALLASTIWAGGSMLAGYGLGSFLSLRNIIIAVICAITLPIVVSVGKYVYNKIKT